MSFMQIRMSTAQAAKPALQVARRAESAVSGAQAATISRRRVHVTAKEVAAAAILGALAVWRWPITVGFLGLAAIFIPTEKLIRIRPQSLRRPAWRTDVMHYFVSSGAVTVLLCGVVALLAAARHFVPSGVTAAVATQPYMLRLIACVVIGDVSGYWMHRACHRSDFLWRFHSVHHSIASMDWLASARFHPVDQLITRGATFAPLYLLGLDATTLGAYAFITGFQAVLVHANVRVPWGPLRWILPTPDFHHWHHALTPYGGAKNFAGYPWVDVVFGTAQMPSKRPQHYGLRTPIATDYVGQLLHPFTDGGK